MTTSQLSREYQWWDRNYKRSKCRIGKVQCNRNEENQPKGFESRFELAEEIISELEDW